MQIINTSLLTQKNLPCAKFMILKFWNLWIQKKRSYSWIKCPMPVICIVELTKNNSMCITYNNIQYTVDEISLMCYQIKIVYEITHMYYFFIYFYIYTFTRLLKIGFLHKRWCFVSTTIIYELYLIRLF